MDEQLSTRLATESDQGALSDLFREAFGRTIPEDVWRWFAHGSPLGANRTYVVEDVQGGVLAASYSLLPIRMRLNGVDERASLCTNVCTHPAYRGRGLFGRIGQYALDHESEFDTPRTIGMPNPAALPGHLKIGWERICELPFLVKTDCQKAEHGCKEVSAFDERVDALLERIAPRFSLLVMKDHQFLNWRVVRRPSRQYVRFIIEDSADIRGYIVIKHFDDGPYLKSHIIALQAENDDALRELLTAAEATAHGRDELNLWTNRNDPYAAALVERGFVEHPGSDLLIMHTNFGEKRLPEEGAWSISLADNDVY